MVLYKPAHVIFYTIIFVFTCWLFYTGLIETYYVEFNTKSIATEIIDGITFRTADGRIIRLTDIEPISLGNLSTHIASDALSFLVYGEKVYIDIDDRSWVDNQGRLLSCVYVDFNSTHFQNINMAMLAGGYASVNDKPNEFNPELWSLYLEKFSSYNIIKFSFFSLVASLMITITLYLFIGRLKHVIPITR